MIEIPEGQVIANQINKTIKGKRIINVTANHSPHKFAWFHGDPASYHEVLTGNTIYEANAYGSMININTGDSSIIIGDGVALRYHMPDQKQPEKHQLLLEFDDSSFISASVQMYGGIWCFNDENEFRNPYYNIAKEKPSPLSNDFSSVYFEKLISLQDNQKLSVKALLATEQRIPGLGNGVLQDILWRAKLHPKCKVNTLNDEDKEILYTSIKAVLSEMTELGGRDTEKDFFGTKGGYKTIMSKNNVGSICTICGGIIKKENYLGGSIYFCENCQKA